MTGGPPEETAAPPPTEAELRAELTRFARRILELEAQDRLLASPADLQTVLGELRRRLFEWEVRRAAELRTPPDPGSFE